MSAPSHVNWDGMALPCWNAELVMVIAIGFALVEVLPALHDDVMQIPVRMTAGMILIQQTVHAW